MSDIEYRKYSKRRMIEILHKEGLVFVKTSLGDKYIIRKADIADFIVIESRATNNKEKMEFSFPQIDEPVLITVGTFFKKANPILKAEIIGRVSFLERFNLRTRFIKVFDLEEFSKFNEKDIGNGKKIAKEFDKLYRKYLS